MRTADAVASAKYLRECNVGCQAQVNYDDWKPPVYSASDCFSILVSRPSIASGWHDQ